MMAVRGRSATGLSLALAMGLSLLPVIPFTPVAHAAPVEVVSTPSLSTTGRFVAFSSSMDELVSDDANGLSDVFLLDRDVDGDNKLDETALGAVSTTRVTIPYVGADVDGASFAPSISADGRFVTFVSEATNLTQADTNGFADVFVYDRDTEQISRASVSSALDQADNDSADPAISSDGRYVSFSSTASNLGGDNAGRVDVFLHDLQAGTTTLVSKAGKPLNGDSSDPSVASTKKGVYVAYGSAATNLVKKDRNKKKDIFLWSKVGSKVSTRSVSVSSGGAQANADSLAPAISANAAFVAFSSTATKLVSKDTNKKADIFVHNVAKKTTARTSLTASGGQAKGPSVDPSLSSDGRYVAFSSKAANLISKDTNKKADIFVYDTKAKKNKTKMAGAPGGIDRTMPRISGNGKHLGHLISTAATGDAFVAAAGSKKMLQLTVPIPPPPPGADPPADPSDVASEVDLSGTTSITESTSFLYEGDNPIQTGVDTSKMDEGRTAIIRGRVLSSLAPDTPLQGVTISILDHPEFGQTVSREDGWFDMAVNGGGLLTLNYEREGFMPLQRQVDVPWQDFAQVVDVVMNRFDSRVTSVSADVNTLQVARGSKTSDSDGSRQSTLMFEPGTTAKMELPNGDMQPIDDLAVRATEYTTGGDGDESMPSELPDTSAFTYAVEYSVDQAEAAGATDVVFNQPVPTYTDNFLEFPVGSPVPAAYYDEEKGLWVPSENGIVIEIVSESDGAADINLDGDPAADPDLYGKHAIDLAERQKLAGIYEPVKQLWRVQVKHFTPWDYNWPFGPPPDAKGPDEGGAGPKKPGGSPDDPSGTPDSPGPGGGPGTPEDGCGSVIGCQTQTLGEIASLSGTGYSLVYNSGRVPGRRDDYFIPIQLIEGEPAADLKAVQLEVQVAGKSFTQRFDAAPDLAYEYEWDGKDAYGRIVQGRQTANIRIGYVYDAQYKRPDQFQSSFGNFGGAPIGRDTARREITLWSQYESSIGSFQFAKPELGGWSLDVHNVYDPQSRRVYLGDGTVQGATVVSSVMETFAGTGADGHLGDNGPASEARIGFARGLDVAPDGSVFVADTTNGVVRKIDKDGTITTFAGGGSPEDGIGDGGAPTDAMLLSPWDVTVGLDGSVFISDTGNSTIRRVSPDGQTISTFAGGGDPDDELGDGGPAIEAELFRPRGIDVGPDGSLYIADSEAHRIRKVGPDGNITTAVGTGVPGAAGDNGPATMAELNLPLDVAVSPDLDLYVSDSENHRIRKVTVDGTIRTFAGTGADGYSGDGGPAVEAKLGTPAGLSFSPDGSLFVATRSFNRIRRILPDGTIIDAAGTGKKGFAGDGLAPAMADLALPSAVAIAPNGRMYVADSDNYRIRRTGSPLPGFSGSDTLVVSSDGSLLWHFNKYGRHLRTLDALTGIVLTTFTYTDGALSSVKDTYNNTVTIQRDANGNPTKIVAPGGQETMLTLNAEGYLTAMSNPAGESSAMGYAPGGLLTSLETPRGHSYAYTYDNRGRLIKDEGPDGQVQTLTRNETEHGYEVILETKKGRQKTFRYETLLDGTLREETIAPNGGSTITKTFADGTVEMTAPSGAKMSIGFGPDPRWGMAAPYAKETVGTSPGGKTRVLISDRTATLSDPDDKTSLVELTETNVLNGRSSTQKYNRATRTMTTITPTGRQTVSTHDENGAFVSAQPGPGIQPVERSYDSLGRVTQVKHGPTEQNYGYDSKNRVTSVTNALGHATSFEFDLADRPVKVITPEGLTYEYRYDASGNRTAVVMPGGEVHELSYSPVGADMGYDPPGDGAFAKSYGDDGELIEKVLPSGRKEEFSYDGAGRTTLNSYPEASIATEFKDPADLTSSMMWSPVGGGEQQKTSFEYDGAMPTKIALEGAADAAFTFEYDDEFRLKSYALQGEPSVSTALTRDQDGLLTGYGPFTFTRQGPGGAASKIVDATSAVDFAFDGLGRLTSKDQAIASASKYKMELAYDDGGRIVQRKETVGGVLTTADYAYDDDGQLISVSKDGVPSEAYAYDANGNLTGRTLGGVTTTATFDAQDRLTAVGGTDYVFDDDGFLAERDGDLFEYSTKGELLAATVGGNEIVYSYDGLGRMTARKEGSDKWEFLYGDPGNPMRVTATRSPSGTLSHFYYDDAGYVMAMQRGTDRFYVATDQVGSPRVITDASGAVEREISYDSFGKVLSDSDPSFEFPFGYAGGIADPDTELVRFGFRDYDPAAGRWTARDPLLYGGGQGNLYAYVGNAPIGGRDPFGLSCVGASAYTIIGAGLKMCNDAQGNQYICIEVGVGVGASVEQSSGYGSAGESVNLELSGGVGAFGASGGVSIDPGSSGFIPDFNKPPGSCPNISFTGKGSAGPVSGAVQQQKKITEKWSEAQTGGEASVGAGIGGGALKATYQKCEKL